MSTARTLTIVTITSLASFLACAGPPSAPAPGPAAQAEPGGEAEPAASSPWASLTRQELVALVREQAAARIREVQPELDVARLAEYAADPSTAPELSDRACEQIVNLAIAEAAADEPTRASALVRLVRARARNRNNAYAGTTILAELARRTARGDAREAVRAVLAELPRNRFGASTVVFQLFQNVGQIDARVQQLHQQLLSLDTAVAALYYDALLRPVVEHRQTFLDAIAQIREQHASQPEPRPYAFSTVDLTRARDAQPVVVAVWDTGVAPGLFESQLFTNPNEQPNGQDDDGNGLVDDVHGVVSDPTEGQTGLTFEPGEAILREYSPFLRGIMDLRAGMASTEAAQRVLALMGQAQDAEALDALERNLDAVGEWAHGTHVAGI
ncbi:MAG TPA: hypothetical protein VIL20_26490, partial [Sandaracinaceae bacterium]